jgi:Zn-dependent protease with chaperone function
VLALAGLAILHGCIAAAFAEGLLRAWRARTPDLRLAVRALALLAPFVSVPLAIWLAPVRESEAVQVQWAIYSGASWDNLRVGGVPLSGLATTVMAVLGCLLFARDTVPFLVDRMRRTGDEDVLPHTHPAARRLAAALADLPCGRTALAPPITLLGTDAVVLYCSGLHHPVLTVSIGTLDRLDDEALRAAMAHELEHAHRKDPALGWLLIAIRTLQPFNPATQVAGRQIVEEIERRADVAVARLGLGLPLARAIATLSAGGTRAESDLAAGDRRFPFVTALADRAAARATADRCARLMRPPEASPAAGTFLTVMAAVCLAALLLLVV